MKIAFIVLAYKLPEQFRLQLQLLKDEHHHFFVHIDRSKDIAPFRKVLIHSGVRYTLVKREYSYWGSYGSVKAVLNGLQAALDSREIFDYVIHLSGQDLPLKNSPSIQHFFKYEEKRNFLHIHPFHLSDDSAVSQRVFDFKFFFKGKRILITKYSKFKAFRFWANFWKVLLKTTQSNTSFFSGEFYFALHRDAVTHLLKQVNKKKILAFQLKFSSLPEELFIHTLLMQNLPASIQVVPDTTRYIDWSAGGKSPRTLSLQDHQKLKSGPYLFARKFDLNEEERGDLLRQFDPTSGNEAMNPNNF